MSRAVVQIVAARRAHVATIAARMRDADVAECRAFGLAPKSALRRSMLASSSAVTALVDGRPEAMMGMEVRSAAEGLGIPWMLATDAAYARGRALLTLGPLVLDSLADSMLHLAGVVGADNTRAIRVLRRWGFEIGDYEHMIGGHAFLPFKMDR